MLEVHPSLFGILACVHCDALKTLHVWLRWASRCRLTARLRAFKGEAPLLCLLYRASASPSQPRATKSLPTPRWEAAVVGLGTSAHVNEQLCRRWQHLASGSIRAHSMRFIQDILADHGPLLPQSRCKCCTAKDDWTDEVCVGRKWALAECAAAGMPGLHAQQQRLLQVCESVSWCGDQLCKQFAAAPAPQPAPHAVLRCSRRGVATTTRPW